MDGAYIALRGYKFQFDKTILEILDNPAKQIKIEQLQDYGYDDYYVQVKYHNTDYTKSQQKQKIKKPILQLIEQFKKNKTQKFILFIYLKGIKPNKTTLSKVSELDAIIGNKVKFTTTEKEDFIKSFTLIFADDFENQYNSVIQKIKSSYSKTLEEAEIYYSVISSYLLDIVINNPPINSIARVTTKSEIDLLIENGKKIIFKSAFVELLSKEKKFKYLNKIFFRSTLNKEPFERFFIIETDKGIPYQILKEIILIIKTKWSKNKTKTIPDLDRFVPYIFFRDTPKITLAKLKKDLQNDGYVIKDGYDFMDAEFNISSMLEKPTFANKLFFKIINNQKDFENIISNINQTKEIYQFFFTNPVSLNTNDKHIKIEIQDIMDIKQII